MEDLKRTVRQNPVDTLLIVSNALGAAAKTAQAT